MIVTFRHERVKTYTYLLKKLCPRNFTRKMIWRFGRRWFFSRLHNYLLNFHHNAVKRGSYCFVLDIFQTSCVSAFKNNFQNCLVDF